MAAIYGSLTIGSTPTLIVSTKNFRRGTLLFNNGSQTIYLGMDTNVTTSNGMPLPLNASLQASGYLDIYRGNIYGIVASGTADLRYWDWEEI